MLKSGVYKKGDVELLDIIKDAAASCDGEAGVIYYYMGIARSSSKFSNEEVKAVIIEAYKEYADLALSSICDDLTRKYGLVSCFIYHLEGTFAPGEPMVLIQICSRHRKEGLAALEEAIERYKKEPTIWKKEVYISGAQKWIEEE